MSTIDFQAELTAAGANVKSRWGAARFFIRRYPLGAAGAVEAIFSILAIRDRVVPPTINLDNPSVETPIDLVPHQMRKRDVDMALSNSFGFGGTNASLIFRRYAN